MSNGLGKYLIENESDLEDIGFYKYFIEKESDLEDDPRFLEEDSNLSKEGFNKYFIPNESDLESERETDLENENENEQYLPADEQYLPAEEQYLDETDKDYYNELSYDDRLHTSTEIYGSGLFDTGVRFRFQASADLEKIFEEIENTVRHYNVDAFQIYCSDFSKNNDYFKVFQSNKSMITGGEIYKGRTGFFTGLGQLRAALLKNRSSNYEPESRKNIEIILKFMSPDIYLEGSGIKNNMRKTLGWAPSFRCISAENENYSLPYLILKPLVQSHIITSEAVNDVKGFNDSCYQKSFQLIKISSYDKTDVELFCKYLLTLKISLDLNVYDRETFLYSHKSENKKIVLNLIQVNKIFRYSVIEIAIVPQPLSEVNIKNRKDKYSQCNIIKGENYCLAKCLVIFLSYAKEEFARIFKVDINILTPSKIKAIRSHSEGELLSWASILSDKFLNKNSENYTSTDVQKLANAFNICIKVLDGNLIVKYDNHSP